MQQKVLLIGLVLGVIAGVVWWFLKPPGQGGAGGNGGNGGKGGGGGTSVGEVSSTYTSLGAPMPSFLDQQTVTFRVASPLSRGSAYLGGDGECQKGCWLNWLPDSDNALPLTVRMCPTSSPAPSGSFALTNSNTQPPLFAGCLEYNTDDHFMDNKCTMGTLGPNYPGDANQAVTKLCNDLTKNTGLSGNDLPASKLLFRMEEYGSGPAVTFNNYLTTPLARGVVMMNANRPMWTGNFKDGTTKKWGTQYVEDPMSTKDPTNRAFDWQYRSADA